MAILVLSGQIPQEPAAVADHLEKPPARMIVFAVFFEMLGYLINLRAQNGYLYLRGSGIPFVRLVFLDKIVFVFLGKHKTILT